MRALNALIKHTGFVVLPYYQYPSFMDTLLSLVKNEKLPELRLELLKLLGNLGVIDTFTYKKVLAARY
jgi:FKBP12-rapamycin complex-associated protein